MKSRVILAGGSGLVGQALAKILLAHNYDVSVLTRAPSHQAGPVHHVNWDGRKLDSWIENLDGALALVNLTGRSINCRHAAENRREIILSRVDSVGALGEAITRCTQPPKVFIQAAGVGIYGDAGDRWCDEGAPYGSGFLAEVSKAWEKAFNEVRVADVRRCLFRLGPVLGPNGGLLKPLARLTRCFLGGHVGSGRQFISWIHIADLAQMFLAAIERDDIAGIFNATSPNPVTNAELMRELRRALRRPWSPPVPKFAARIGSWLIGTQADLAFVSQRCTPKRFLESGFNFGFPELRPALANIYPNS